MSAPKRSRVTIEEVARVAEVSTATVSRALAGRAVRPELAERVRAAAVTLDYQPNRAAQALVSGRSRTVGVVVPDLANPYFSAVLKAVTAHSLADGFRTVVADADNIPDAEPELCRTLLRQTDGLVVVSPRMPADELRTLAASNDKIVLVNRVIAGVSLPVVAVDAFGGMFRMCGHLARLGHRRVVYLAGPSNAWQNTERRRAVEQARLFGLDAAVVTAGATLEEGEAAVDAAMSHYPTALIGFNDLVAVGALLELLRRGVRVPEDMSVTGADDIPLAERIHTGLTTTQSPLHRLGEQAWRLLDAAITDQGVVAPPLLAPSLKERGSTGVPRSRVSDC